MTTDPKTPASHQNGGAHEEAVEAATRIVSGWQRSLSQTGYYEEDDPLRVARALLDSADRERKYREALALILPLAKGYAAEHPVGSNQAYVDEAEEALALPTEQDKGWRAADGPHRGCSEETKAAMADAILQQLWGAYRVGKKDKSTIVGVPLRLEEIALLIYCLEPEGRRGPMTFKEDRI